MVADYFLGSGTANALVLSAAADGIFRSRRFWTDIRRWGLLSQGLSRPVRLLRRWVGGLVRGTMLERGRAVA